MCVLRGRIKRLLQEHKAERATGARVIRPCITHTIDATAALRLSTGNAQRTPLCGHPHLWCGEEGGAPPRRDARAALNPKP